MADVKRLNASQLLFRIIVIALSVLVGLVLVLIGLGDLLAQKRSIWIQLPIGVILLVFGIGISVVVIRQQRRFPKL